MEKYNDEMDAWEKKYGINKDKENRKSKGKNASAKKDRERSASAKKDRDKKRK